MVNKCSNFKDMVGQLFQEGAETVSLLYTTWSIWTNRNEHISHHKAKPPKEIYAYASSMIVEFLYLDDLDAANTRTHQIREDENSIFPGETNKGKEKMRECIEVATSKVPSSDLQEGIVSRKNQ